MKISIQDLFITVTLFAFFFALARDEPVDVIWSLTLYSLCVFAAVILFSHSVRELVSQVRECRNDWTLRPLARRVGWKRFTLDCMIGLLGIMCVINANYILQQATRVNWLLVIVPIFGLYGAYRVKQEFSLEI